MANVMKTCFEDAIETKVPSVGGNTVPNLPSGSGSPITNSPFKDAIETHVPNTRTGGLLPEHMMDTNIAPKVPVPPETGKTFKIG